MNYKVKSRSEKDVYHTVSDHGTFWECTCTSYGIRHKCRHIELIKMRMGLTYSPIKGRCTYCGKRDGVAEHHIWKRSLKPEMINDPKNKILLCAQCHELTESSHAFLEHLKQFYGRGSESDTEIKLLR